MTEMTHEQMLASLEGERSAARRTLDQLRRDLVAAESQVQDLDAAIAAIRKLVPAAATEPGPRLELAEFETADSGEHERHEGDDEDRRRIPSTDIVIAIVESASAPIKTSEIFSRFASEHGIPPTWADPKSAVAVAIKRAVARGSIARLGRGEYAAAGRTTRSNEGREIAVAQ